MNLEELNKVKDLCYLDYCVYLKNKYGAVPKSYFTSETYKYKNQKNGRGKEGLFIHHIKENEFCMLSNPEACRIQKIPFEYQSAENLCYCDLLEHLLLHIKIVSDYSSKTVGVGGIYNFIIPQCKLYLLKAYTPSETSWISVAKKKITDNPGVFYELEKLAWEVIENKFGKENLFNMRRTSDELFFKLIEESFF